MEILPKNPVWVLSPHDGVHYPAVLLQGGATAAVGSGGQMPASVKVKFPVGTNVKALFPDSPSPEGGLALDVSPFYVEPIATDLFIRRFHEKVKPLWTSAFERTFTVAAGAGEEEVNTTPYWGNLLGNAKFQPQTPNTLVWVRRCERESIGEKCCSSAALSASATNCCCWYEPGFTVKNAHTMAVHTPRIVVGLPRSAWGDPTPTQTTVMDRATHINNEKITIQLVGSSHGPWTACDFDARDVEPIIADFENRRHHPKVLPIWDQFVRTVRGGGPNVYTAQAHSNHLKWTGHDANLQKKAEMVLLQDSLSVPFSSAHRSYEDISYETDLSEDVIAAFRKEAIGHRQRIAETRAHLKETIDRLRWLVEEERELKQRVMREVAKQSTIIKPEQTARRAIERGMNADAVALKKAYDLATAVAKAKEAAKGRQQTQAVKREEETNETAIIMGGTHDEDECHRLFTGAVEALLSVPQTPIPNSTTAHAPAPSPSASSSSAFLHQVSSTFTCSRCGALVPIAEGPAHRQHHFDEFERSFRNDVEAAERAALLDQRLGVGSVIEAENDRIRIAWKRALDEGPKPTRRTVAVSGVKREREDSNDQQEDGGDGSEPTAGGEAS